MASRKGRRATAERTLTDTAAPAPIRQRRPGRSIGALRPALIRAEISSTSRARPSLHMLDDLAFLPQQPRTVFERRLLPGFTRRLVDTSPPDAPLSLMHDMFYALVDVTGTR
jgi:hypothetical protein